MRPIVLSICAVAAVALLAPAGASAQGCVCQRQGGPLFGGVSPYMNPGDWSLQLFHRAIAPVEEHFRGTAPLTELDANGPRNVQH